MIEDLYFLDEGHLTITAASVGIGSKRWTCILESEINDLNYYQIMKSNRFDILPIVHDSSTTEYFKTN